jgi:hypothetical protein
MGQTFTPPGRPVGAGGAMERLIETSVAYATDREAFGRPIGKFQAIRHHLAEMATKAEASRALTYNALRLFHENQDCIQEVSMAKLMTQRAVLEIADQSLQIHGGYGYMREYGIERAVRDASLGPIGGGTDEIRKEIFGKTMGLQRRGRGRGRRPRPLVQAGSTVPMCSLVCQRSAACSSRSRPLQLSCLRLRLFSSAGRICCLCRSGDLE